MNKNFLKRFAADFIYGVVGLVILNGVLVLVNAYLNRALGDDGQGKVLFYTSIMGLMASAFGCGANYARMKISTEHKTENGDYNWFLLMVTILVCIVSAVAIFVKPDTVGATYPEIVLLIALAVFRYYGDVQYRLDLNYRGFFFYYIIITAGYIVGIVLYQFCHRWVFIFICGELAGLLFVFFKGTIFKRPFWKHSKQFPQNVKMMSSLSTSYLLSDFVSYTDRLMLSLLVSDAAAAHFYIATLVGKMTALLSTPLNGVIIGHLSKYKGKFTKKMFAAVCSILLLLAGVITLGSVIGSHLVVWILYPNTYEEVKSLFILANAGQVFFFLCNTLMVVVLRFASEKYQLFIGIIYAILFFVGVLPVTIHWGIWGCAWGLFLLNVIKFVLICAAGFLAIKQIEKTS